MAKHRRYEVAGVDRKTRQDVRATIEAASMANAKMKAELDGIAVTDVRYAAPKPVGENSQSTHAEPSGWTWSDMSGRARCMLIASILLGAGGVFGIIALGAGAGKDSPWGMGLLALLLLPFGVAGAMASKG